MLPHDHGRSGTKFINATLRGGPFDGQHVHISDDECRHVVYDDTEPHAYVRITQRPEFIWEPDAAAMFGGGK